MVILTAEGMDLLDYWLKEWNDEELLRLISEKWCWQEQYWWRDPRPVEIAQGNMTHISTNTLRMGNRAKTNVDCMYLLYCIKLYLLYPSCCGVWINDEWYHFHYTTQTFTTRGLLWCTERQRVEKEQVLPMYKWARETLLGTLNRLFVSNGEWVVETETSQPAPGTYAVLSQGPERCRMSWELGEE